MTQDGGTPPDIRRLASELLESVEARRRLDAGFKGMGVNIVVEKAHELGYRAMRLRAALGRSVPQAETMAEGAERMRQEIRDSTNITERDLSLMVGGRSVPAEPTPEQREVIESVTGLVPYVRHDSNCRAAEADGPCVCGMQGALQRIQQAAFDAWRLRGAPPQGEPPTP